MSRACAGKQDLIDAPEPPVGIKIDGVEMKSRFPRIDRNNRLFLGRPSCSYASIGPLFVQSRFSQELYESSMLMNQADNLIISACMLKTHDRAVCTRGIKNIVLGAPLKLGGGMGGVGGLGRGGRGFGGFGGSDKSILHGGGAHGININLAMLAPLPHPSLTVIDGFEGMESNGPIAGTRVDHRVCVVSTDYPAADAVAASLMGIDPANVGYLHYLVNAKVGESDLSKMEILGEPVAKLAKKYQLGPSTQQQLQWENPARVTATQ